MNQNIKVINLYQLGLCTLVFHVIETNTESYSPSLNPKEYTNESDVTDVIDRCFQYHSSTAWITDEIGSKRKVKLLRDSDSLQSLFSREKPRLRIPE